MKKNYLILSVFIIFLFSSCKKEDITTKKDLLIKDELASLSSCGSTYRNNCVLFIRCAYPGLLPVKNLTSQASKLSIINSHTPKAGEVAIFDMGSYGHVAYVNKVVNVNGKVTIYLNETNNPNGSIHTNFPYPLPDTRIRGYHSR